MNGTDGIDIDRLLREAAPRVTTSPATGAVLAGIAHAIAAENPVRGRRRRSRAFVVGAVAALCLAGTGVAAAAVVGAHTGWFGSPNPGSPEGTDPDSTEADGSEWIDIGAADYVTVAVSLWPVQATLPEGYDVAGFARGIAEATVRVNAEQNGGGSALRQVTGIRSEFEQYARCAWRTEWLEADAAGDTVRAALAATTLETAATWPATVATDGGGIVDVELSVARAALAGDRNAVEATDAWCGDLLAGAGAAR